MENFTRNLRAVIFDMDGTLIDTERIGAASWVHAGEETGLVVSEDVKQNMVGRNMVDISAMTQAAFPEEDVSYLLERANFHYHRLVTEQPPPIKTGALELLEWLQERNVPMAVATSSQLHQAHDKLSRTKLRHFFSYIIAGDQIDRGKPDPEIFERAAEGMGIPVRNCAIVEDSAPGIEAAQRSGALALWVPEFFPVDAGVALFADHIFEDLHQVQRWIVDQI